MLLVSQIVRVHHLFQLWGPWMPQCKGLYLCLSGFPKVLPCSSGPVSQPPRSIRTGYCAAMAQMPDGENPLSSMYHVVSTASVSFFSQGHCLTKVCFSHVHLGAPPQPHYSQRMKCVIHTDTRHELPNILRLHTYQQGEQDLILFLWSMEIKVLGFQISLPGNLLGALDSR